MVEAIRTCDICGKSFRDNYNRNVHEIEQHTKKYNFHCEECGKGFAEKYKLDLHKLEKHKDFETTPDATIKKYLAKQKPNQEIRTRITNKKTYRKASGAHHGIVAPSSFLF